MTKYFWATDGLRWRCDERVMAPPTRQWCTNYRQAAFDGEWYYSLELDGLRGTKGSKPVAAEFKTTVFYLMMDRRGQPLSEFWSQPGAKLAGQENLAGENCYKLEYEDTLAAGGTRTVTCWLLADMGLVPKRIDLRILWPVPRADSREIGRRSILTAEEFTQVDGGLWLPTTVKNEIYAALSDGTFKWRKTTVFRVNEILVNTDVQDLVFALQFPIGASVEDAVSAMSRTVGGEFDAERIKLKQVPLPEQH